MSRSSVHFAVRVLLLAPTLAISPALFAGENGPANHSQHGQGRGHMAPVYQRHAFEWMNTGDGWHGNGRHWSAPPVSAGWFQRPYPYHLDYYRMRYGGSYAPYFGNLYGPPQVVTAPPYYGPYYGGWGPAAGGYGANGYGAPLEYPANGNAAMHEGPALSPNASGGQNAPPNGESLPAPQQP